MMESTQREVVMTRSEIIEFVKRNPTSCMATVEGGSPRVRYMETPLVDDGGLTFLTGSNKPVCAQLTENPEVELCYWSPEERLQLRIRGSMEKLEQDDIKREIVETKFTFLKPVAEQYGLGAFAVFRLAGGEVRTWSGENPAGPSEVFEF
jgi:uncharacterized pyridoxamine 5'-phosphate oxidase family protein